eukprot:scaffold109014_cov54-Phaeocystis_antarctica.AAC.3
MPARADSARGAMAADELSERSDDQHGAKFAGAHNPFPNTNPSALTLTSRNAFRALLHPDLSIVGPWLPGGSASCGQAGGGAMPPRATPASRPSAGCGGRR